MLGAGERSNCDQEEGPTDGRTGGLRHPCSLEVSRSPCLLRGGACKRISSHRDPLGVTIGPASNLLLSLETHPLRPDTQRCMERAPPSLQDTPGKTDEFPHWSPKACSWQTRADLKTSWKVGASPRCAALGPRSAARLPELRAEGLLQHNSPSGGRCCSSGLRCRQSATAKSNQ